LKKLYDLPENRTAANGHGEQNQKGILDQRSLPDSSFDALWESIVLDSELKDRLLAQAILNFTLRGKIDSARIPLHGIILLVGPPGTGKTSLARGLASKTARSFGGQEFKYLEVEPHALAGAALGKSQQAVRNLLGTVIAERAEYGPVIVLLDEVETLAADRAKMSMEANPVDVHRATDAVLAQLDQLATKFPQLLFVATSNFPKAIDAAFLSRVDQIVTIGLPTKDACGQIALDTIAALGTRFHKIGALSHDRALANIGERCLGLDGRQIRKAIVSSLTSSKGIAVDPNQVKATDVLRAIDQAKAESTKAK
jgi:AAA+ superfamily predicted ATPase